MFKFNVKNINIFLNNIKTKEKKKIEANITNNLRIIKTENGINEKNNNKIDKINANKKNEIKKTLNEFEKNKKNFYVKKMNIYNTKNINNQTGISQDNFFKQILGNRNTFRNNKNQNSFINMNKTEVSFDIFNNEKLSLRYYKTMKERKEIKEYNKKRYISIFKKLPLVSDYGSQENNILRFNKYIFGK